MLDEASVLKYKTQIDQREIERTKRLDEDYKYAYTRPREMCIKMMRKELDEIKDAATKATISKFIAETEKKWTAEYEESKKKKSK